MLDLISIFLEVEPWMYFKRKYQAEISIVHFLEIITDFSITLKSIFFFLSERTIENLRIHTHIHIDREMRVYNIHIHSVLNVFITVNLSTTRDIAVMRD